MSDKTDKEIFGEDTEIRISTKGRPKVNEDLVRRLLDGKKYTPAQIAKRLDCHPETIRRIRRRLEKEGTLEAPERNGTKGLVEADFDTECESAMGISFLGWLTAKRKKPRGVFNFCRRTWDHVWGKPSLVRVTDRDDPLGRQLCLKFLETFDDKGRSRGRKKHIRQLFIFLDRRGLCDQFLTMSQSRDPRPVRKVPEINSPMFPAKIGMAINAMTQINELYGLMCRFKKASQCRTGNRKEERGLLGIRVGSQSKSYISMDDADHFQIEISEKMGEEWAVSWLPKKVRDELWEHYKTLKNGDYLFPIPVRKFRNDFGDMTEKHCGVRLIPHDLRKISLTWLYVSGVRLEVATRINVGWKDLSTADRHYVNLGAMLRTSIQKEYSANIPEWFKDGLDDYIRGDADTIAKLLKIIEALQPPEEA